MKVDTAVRGELINKDIEEHYALIEDMARNHYQWGRKSDPIEKEPKKEAYIR